MRTWVGRLTSWILRTRGIPMGATATRDIPSGDLVNYLAASQ